MKWFQGMGIQGKLVSIFGVVFLAGVLTLGWNITSINRSKENVTDSLVTNRADVIEKLQAGKTDVVEVLTASMQDANSILERMDVLLILQIIEIDFRELEAIEKDLVMFDDLEYVDESTADYEYMLQVLAEDLDFAAEIVVDPDTLLVIEQLEEERLAQEEFFYQLVDLMETDPEEARYLSIEASFDRIDNIYNVLADTVGADWDATFDDFDQTWERVESTIAQGETRLQTAISQTDADMQAVMDETDSDLQTAINVGIITLVLFLVAGGLVVMVVVIVSRRIVQPVLVMSQVAESIEREEFETDPLEPFAPRQDEIGVLARVFHRMAKEVYARMEHLKQQVAELQIVIDTKKVSEQVSEITETDYFQNLQARARALREQSSSLQGETPSSDAEPETG